MGSLLRVIFYFVTVGKENVWLQRFSLSTLEHTVWYNTISYYVSHEITAFVSYQLITGSWEVAGSRVKICSQNSQNWEPAARLSAVCDKTKRTSAITSDTWQLSGALLFSCTWCKSKSGKIICTPLSHVALPLYGSMISPFSSPELHGANCRLKVAMLLSLR